MTSQSVFYDILSSNILQYIIYAKLWAHGRSGNQRLETEKVLCACVCTPWKSLARVGVIVRRGRSYWDDR